MQTKKKNILKITCETISFAINRFNCNGRYHGLEKHFMQIKAGEFHENGTSQ